MDVASSSDEPRRQFARSFRSAFTGDTAVLIPLALISPWFLRRTALSFWARPTVILLCTNVPSLVLYSYAIKKP